MTFLQVLIVVLPLLLYHAVVDCETLCDRLHASPMNASWSFVDFPILSLGFVADRHFLLITKNGEHVYDLPPPPNDGPILDPTGSFIHFETAPVDSMDFAHKWPTLADQTAKLGLARLAFTLVRPPNSTTYLVTLAQTGKDADNLIFKLPDQMFRGINTDTSMKFQIWLSPSDDAEKDKLYRVSVADPATGNLQMVDFNSSGPLTGGYDLISRGIDRQICLTQDGQSVIFYSTTSETICRPAQWPVRRGFIARGSVYLFGADKQVYSFSLMGYHQLDRAVPLVRTRFDRFFICDRAQLPPDDGGSTKAGSGPSGDDQATGPDHNGRRTALLVAICLLAIIALAAFAFIFYITFCAPSEPSRSKSDASKTSKQTSSSTAQGDESKPKASNPSAPSAPAYNPYISNVDTGGESEAAAIPKPETVKQNTAVPTEEKMKKKADETSRMRKKERQSSASSKRRVSQKTTKSSNSRKKKRTGKSSKQKPMSPALKIRSLSKDHGSRRVSLQKLIKDRGSQKRVMTLKDGAKKSRDNKKKRSSSSSKGRKQQRRSSSSKKK